MTIAPCQMLQGDCTLLLRQLLEQGMRVDAVVTDPPYHLASIVSRLGASDAAPIQSGKTGAYARASSGFMGQQWDGGDVAFRAETWRAVYAVMKPGAHLIAFSATRTYHRMVCAIEDAGFEIRDMVPWLYGTGFPKSHNLHGEWEGWGTALKPAIEPVVLARKPIIGSIPDNMRLFGTGALNIDACRVPTDEAITATRNVALGSSGSGVYGGANVPGSYEQQAGGRWPANICHDGSVEVLEAFAAFGERGALAPVVKRRSDVESGRVVYNRGFGGTIDPDAKTFQGDSGTAARFFYSSKATEGERVFECRICGIHTLGKTGCDCKNKDGEPDIRSHPTVKPIELMRWYVRMVCPPGGLVLDPFAGTGTTAAAARAEGMQSLMIEQEEAHCRDIAVRLGSAFEELVEARVAPRPIDNSDAGPLFGSAA